MSGGVYFYALPTGSYNNSIVNVTTSGFTSNATYSIFNATPSFYQVKIVGSMVEANNFTMFLLSTTLTAISTQCV